MDATVTVVQKVKVGYTLSWKPQPTPADITKLTAPWTGILSDSSQKQSAQFKIPWLLNTSIHGNTVHVLLQIGLLILPRLV